MCILHIMWLVIWFKLKLETPSQLEPQTGLSRHVYFLLWLRNSYEGIITARIRSLREGNVFTCQSVCPTLFGGACEFCP